MAPKAKTQKTETLNNEAETIVEEMRILEVAQIIPSPLLPQQRRRERFEEDEKAKAELAGLANSIKSHGLVNPITVRPFGENFELVAGERRWRATQLAGLPKIKCIIRPLSDAGALEIQLIENLQRKEVHPMDAALWYKELKETLKITDEELALRVEKPLKDVQKILKLNKLIPEAQIDLERNLITVGHALQIALFETPEEQLQVLNLCYESVWQSGKTVPDKNRQRTVRQLIFKVQSDVLLQLSSAQFSRTDPNLRADKLVCGKCPQRTGAKESLFEEFHENKNDRCLNRQCFEAKTIQHVKNTFEEVNSASIAAYKLDSDYLMPIITWMPGSQSALKEIFKRNILKDGDYVEIKEGDCENEERGIYLDFNGRFGKVINLCQTKNCPVHNKRFFSQTSSVKNVEDPEKKTEERLQRKEELFDYRVGKNVQIRVLKEAMPKFNPVMPDGSSLNIDWLREFVTRVWSMQDRHDSNVHGIIEDIAQKWTPIKITGYLDSAQWKKFFDELTYEQMLQLLFLFTHAHKGTMFYDSYVSQKEVVALAETYDVNHRLIDAEERYNLTQTDKQYKKHTSTFKQYMDDVRAGKDEKIPRVWSTKYKPKV